MSNTAVILKENQAIILGNILTKELKSIIKEKGLYVTGKLHNSIKFTVQVSKTTSSFRITVNGEFYFKYLDKKYNLTETLLRSNTYKTALQKFEEFISENIEFDILMRFKQLKKT